MVVVLGIAMWIYLEMFKGLFISVVIYLSS